ncbi:hypothetical protein E2C01_019559 [Portunus trituberculatus]|uniref:Uncharacterized protein n=1 Tax=Portunus trituberculatus TaxID=210409 RepID=A0A5B7DXJ3_PORTR|nr:hypothetical protein [Portunus trituberculatus]
MKSFKRESEYLRIIVKSCATTWEMSGWVLISLTAALEGCKGEGGLEWGWWDAAWLSLGMVGTDNTPTHTASVSGCRAEWGQVASGVLQGGGPEQQ